MVQFKTHILKAAVDLFQWRRKVGGGWGKLAKVQIPAHAPDVALAQCKVSEEDVPLRIWRIFENVVLNDTIWCTIFHIFYIVQHVSSQLGFHWLFICNQTHFMQTLSQKWRGHAHAPSPCTSKDTVTKGIQYFIVLFSPLLLKLF